MPVRGDPDSLLIGRTLDDPSGDLKAALKGASEDRFDFVAIPLAAPGGQGRGAEMRPSVDSDLVLDSSTWRSVVVGVASDALEPDTAQSPAEACARCEALETELRWAGHLGLRAVLLPPPAAAAGGCGYARAVSGFLHAGVFPEAQGEEGVAPPGPALRVPAGKGGWHAWNRFRTLCGHHQRLWAALELTEGGAAGMTERDVERWLGEPVRFVVLPAAAFVANKQGFPVLPKMYKALMLGLFRYKVQVILSAPQGGAGQEQPADAPEAAPVDLWGPRLSYLARLFQSLPALTPVQRFAHSHLDCLQAPLQPLADNLESETYELFETDPVKYAQYEEAVLAFLRERLAAGRTPPFAVMVLGAGRGPLVAASLRAAKRAETAVSVWAVDKNPNAVHALRHRQRTEEAWSCVEVVAGDMRSWTAPRKADVIVSELLGSFGDNELSPECIDGAQRFLAEDGVCIPRSYTSSLQPVSAAALWADARGRSGSAELGSDPNNLDMAYVVQLHRAFYPCSGPKDCFTYKHPNWELESNDRRCELAFEAETDALVHGFAGYFDCELYGDARISIHPATASDGMFSWFPMFFPLQAPVFLRKGETIRIHLWRLHDAQKAWYEWALSEPAPSAAQNPGGRAWPIGLL